MYLLRWTEFGKQPHKIGFYQCNKGASRNSVWVLTPLAAVPFFFCVLRWFCMLAVSAQRGQALIFQMTAVVYLAGALVLLIGWVQATRLLARSQLTVSPTASAPENHSTR
jgi:hypothetical protein